MEPLEPITDVLIIGGRHAGLSAALTLYRALHTVVIFDHHKPRNNYSTAVHLTPTWENKSPEQMIEASRQELRNNNLTTFVDAGVKTLEKLQSGIFTATDEKGRRWLGRKVLLAIGARDVFPNIPGYPALYTRGMCVHSTNSSPSLRPSSLT